MNLSKLTYWYFPNAPFFPTNIFHIYISLPVFACGNQSASQPISIICEKTKQIINRGNISEGSFLYLLVQPGFENPRGSVLEPPRHSGSKQVSLVFSQSLLSSTLLKKKKKNMTEKSGKNYACNFSGQPWQYC